VLGDAEVVQRDGEQQRLGVEQFVGQGRGEGLGLGLLGSALPRQQPGAGDGRTPRPGREGLGPEVAAHHRCGRFSDAPAGLDDVGDLAAGRPLDAALMPVLDQLTAWARTNLPVERCAEQEPAAN
jgi:hypothetical protein